MGTMKVVSKENIYKLLNDKVLVNWVGTIGGFNLILREDEIVIHVMIDSDIYDYRENSDIISTEVGIERDINHYVSPNFDTPVVVKFHSYGTSVLSDINRIKQLFR